MSRPYLTWLQTCRRNEARQHATRRAHATRSLRQTTQAGDGGGGGCASARAASQPHRLPRHTTQPRAVECNPAQAAKQQRMRVKRNPHDPNGPVPVRAASVSNRRFLSARPRRLHRESRLASASTRPRRASRYESRRCSSTNNSDGSAAAAPTSLRVGVSEELPRSRAPSRVSVPARRALDRAEVCACRAMRAWSEPATSNDKTETKPDGPRAASDERRRRARTANDDGEPACRCLGA